KETVNANLENLKKDVKNELDTLLKKYVLDSAIKVFSNLPDNISNFFNRDKDEFEFDSKQEAKLFAEQIAASAKQIIERQLDVACKETDKKTEGRIQKLSELLDNETKPIIERAQERLKRDFDVIFKPDILKLVDIYIEVNTPNLEFRGYGLSDLLAALLEEAFGNLFVQFAAGLVAMVANNPILSTIYGVVSTVFGWLLRVDVDKHVYKERYTVNLILFKGEIVKFFDNKVEEIQEQSNRLIEQSLEQQIKRYFDDLDSILGDYRNDLEQSLKAQALPLERLKELKQALESFSVGNDKLQVDKLKEKANELLSQTKSLIAS
ncbi:MAG TPA: hypothetical protein VLA84_01425, partial [Microcoleus sp.]|nr:hypothetical protein [Microcoleus sp.]